MSNSFIKPPQKTIFLDVSGGDYAAIDFSRNYSVKNFYNSMVMGGRKFEIIDNDDDIYAEIEIVEFDGELSEESFNFVKDKLCDYDNLKSHDMYWIGLEDK